MANPVQIDGSPEVITVEVRNNSFNKRTLKELKFNKYKSVVISRVIRGDRNIIALNDTVILKGDRLVAVGIRINLDAFCKDVGKEVNTEFKNSDHVKLRKVIVNSEDMFGKKPKRT